jgi:hypothetical protein
MENVDVDFNYVFATVCRLVVHLLHCPDQGALKRPRMHRKPGSAKRDDLLSVAFEL